jgi:hypothetical protein
MKKLGLLTICLLLVNSMEQNRGTPSRAYTA